MLKGCDRSYSVGVAGLSLYRLPRRLCFGRV